MVGIAWRNLKGRRGQCASGSVVEVRRGGILWPGRASNMVLAVGLRRGTSPRLHELDLHTPVVGRQHSGRRNSSQRGAPTRRIARTAAMAYSEFAVCDGCVARVIRRRRGPQYVSERARRSGEFATSIRPAAPSRRSRARAWRRPVRCPGRVGVRVRRRPATTRPLHGNRPYRGSDKDGRALVDRLVASRS